MFVELYRLPDLGDGLTVLQSSVVAEYCWATRSKECAAISRALPDNWLDFCDAGNVAGKDGK